MFKKEVTVKQIGEYLDRYGWKQHHEVPEPGEQEGLVETGWTLDGSEGHRMVIDPIVEKSLVVFNARKVLMAPPDSTPSDRLSGLLLTMSALNYRLVLGDWAYDPRDGEVLFRIGVPVDDGELDYKTFEHCIQGVVATVESDGPKLKGIVEGTTEVDDVLREKQLPVGGPIG